MLGTARSVAFVLLALSLTLTGNAWTPSFLSPRALRPVCGEGHRCSPAQPGPWSRRGSCVDSVCSPGVSGSAVLCPARRAVFRETWRLRASTGFEDAPGDELDGLDLAEEADAPGGADAAPGPWRIEVVYEDEDVLVVNKPCGLGFHTEEDGTPGVLRELRLQQASGALGYTGVLFPVHRLDKVTSGALLLAKSREAAGELATAFRERRVAKFYVAIADKKPKKAQGTVKGDMARTRRAAWRLLRECTRPAVTQFVSAPYREDEAGPGCEGGAPLRLFVMKPLTGRTHQLRVALRSLAAPIVGDSLYYPGGAAGEDRAYLHAAALRVPLRGRAVQVVVPPWDACGRRFADPGLRAAFSAFFSDGLAAERGTWFPDTKLLRAPPPEELRAHGTPAPRA